MPDFTTMQNVTAFRKIAFGAWGGPTNPQVFASVDIDYSAAAGFTARYNRVFGARITPTHVVGRALGIILQR